MTNIFTTPKKLATRTGLFSLGVEALEKEGWKVSRIARGGKASLRQIEKDGEKRKVSIRTSQDAWIAFPRKSHEAGWVTLDEVDFVVASSVNDRHNPTVARAHLIPADEVRDRFERAYAARKAAGHTLPVGRGIWLSLYDGETASPVSLVGAGMGLKHQALVTVDLTKRGLPAGSETTDSDVTIDDDEPENDANLEAQSLTSLTIPEAKRLLAMTMGVPETAIKITIEH